MDHSLTAEIELWEKVYTVLRSDSALVAAIPDPDDATKSKVRDINNMPTGWPMPYIALGAHQRFSDRTFGNDGQKIIFALEIWSGFHGRMEALQINNMIYNALPDDDFNTTHFHCIGGFTSEQGIFQPENSTGVELMHYTASYSAILQRI